MANTNRHKRKNKDDKLSTGKRKKTMRLKTEFIEISIDLNNPYVPAEQTNPNETTKAKKQTEKSKLNNKNNEVIEITSEANIPVDIDQTNSTDDPKKTKRKNKDSEILEHKLEKTEKVELGNEDPLSLIHYECDHCQKRFCRKSSLQTHMLMHLDLKPYSCPHCPNSKFRQRGNWRAHIARIHPETFKKMKYECNICRKPFTLLGHLKLHQKVHANERQQRNTCEFCKTVFKNKYQLVRHKKLHMAPGHYKCIICSMNFVTRTLFSDHLKTHRQVQDFSCQLCSKSFERPSSIARHIRVSHGGKRMQCPVCNKLLKGHLSEHMRTHENQRRHKCDVCGQKFTQSTQLTVHKRSHTGVKPYSCRICMQPFSHSNVLMLHIRKHTGEKPFECALCPQTFSQIPHMKAHMRKIHKKMEFYKCNNCNMFFKLKTALEAHEEGCGEAGSVKKKDKLDDTFVSRIRFLLALYFTLITSKEKLNDLGFNKRLIDDILVEAIELMGLTPCTDASLAVLPRLQANALMLLRGTVPKQQMARFAKENKSTEEILEMLTGEQKEK